MRVTVVNGTLTRFTLITGMLVIVTVGVGLIVGTPDDSGGSAVPATVPGGRTGEALAPGVGLAIGTVGTLLLGEAG